MWRTSPLLCNSVGNSTCFYTCWHACAVPLWMPIAQGHLHVICRQQRAHFVFFCECQLARVGSRNDSTPFSYAPITTLHQCGCQNEKDLCMPCATSSAAFFFPVNAKRPKLWGLLPIMEVQGVRRNLRLLPDQSHVDVPLWYVKVLLAKSGVRPRACAAGRLLTTPRAR